MASPRKTRSASRDTPLLPPSELPARTRRSPRRKEPSGPALPPLSKRTSNAYGAEGKINITEGIGGSNSGDLSGAFQNTRGTAVNSTGSVFSPLAPIAESPAQNNPQASRSPSPMLQTMLPQNSLAKAKAKGKGKAKAPVASNNDESDELDSGSEAPQAIKKGKAATKKSLQSVSAQPGHHDNTMQNATMVVDHTTQLASGNPQTPPTGFVRAGSERGRNNNAAEPEFAPLWLEYWRSRNTRKIITLVLLIPLLLSVFAALYHSGGFSSTTVDFTQPSTGLSVVDSIKSAGNKAWMSVSSVFDGTSPAMQVGNHKFNKRDKKFELLDRTMDELKGILPGRIAVQKKDNGEIEIPDTFWHAIMEKFEQDTHYLKPHTPAWDEFVARNDRKVDDLLEKLREQGTRRLEEAFGKSRILDTKEFVDELNENYAALHTQVSTVSNKLQKQINEIMASRAQDSTSYHFHEVSQLVQANILKNTELAMKRVDFFSAKLGARINPKLTSPVFEGDEWFYERIFRMFNGFSPLSPINALLPWFEAGDCWCASTGHPKTISNLWGYMDSSYTPDPAFHPDGTPNLDPQGPPVAQLAIAMPRRVMPRSVTVEHVPKSGTLDPDAAPMWMELWGEVLDPFWHTDLERLSDRIFSSLTNWVMRSTKHEEGIHLPSTYVLLAKFRYDIDGQNHVQNFPVDVDVGDVATQGIKKAVVRIVTNGGSDHTCIYRVRLHGDRT